jgi:hypothetical protein
MDYDRRRIKEVGAVQKEVETVIESVREKSRGGRLSAEGQEWKKEI